MLPVALAAIISLCIGMATLDCCPKSSGNDIATDGVGNVVDDLRQVYDVTSYHRGKHDAGKDFRSCSTYRSLFTPQRLI